MRDFFFSPVGAVAADFIPFYEGGQFRLFYLQDFRNHAEKGEGTPWYRVDTEDFVHYRECGEMLARGSVEEQDLYVFTGCVLAANGIYHIFYTGHNPHLRRAGKPEQAVMHAVSDDLTHWTKVPEDTFFAPAEGYEPHDWRDPFVFWNEEKAEWQMLLAARTQTGPIRRRGCTALCASKDLKAWEVREPLWSPELYFTHECPDLFRMGAWWYLVYSEFSDRVLTRYKMAKSLDGPWLTPDDDQFDGRAFYAAKSAADTNGRRFLFGWNPTRIGEKDEGGWMWGGNLVVHELRQQPDGSLTSHIPETLKAAFGRTLPLVLSERLGTSDSGAITQNGATATIAAPGTFRAATTAEEMPRTCRITVTITPEIGTKGCGILLRGSDDFEQGYYIRLEPYRNRLVFDRWPRPGDQPFALELERPLLMPPGKPIELTVFVDGTVCVVYADNGVAPVALNARLYDHKAGRSGIFVQEGAARFTNLSLSTGAGERE